MSIAKISDETEVKYAVGTARRQAMWLQIHLYLRMHIQITDRLGSIEKVTDISSTSENAICTDVYVSYDAWGNAESNGNLEISGIKVDVVSFTGYNYNEYNNLYYAVNRMYDTDTYGFTARDRRIPDLTRPSSFETYVYAENNPITYIDPTGLGIIKDAISWACDKFGGLIADSIETASDIIRGGLEKVHELTVDIAKALNINDKVFRTGVTAAVATGAALSTGVGLPVAMISLFGVMAAGV